MDISPYETMSKTTQPALSLRVARWRRVGAMCPQALQRAGSLPPRLLNHPRAICRWLPDWATATFGRLPRTPLAPRTAQLNRLPPGINALSQPFHLLYRCKASGRASHSPAVRYMAFSSRAVPLPPSPPHPPPRFAADCFCGTTSVLQR